MTIGNAGACPRKSPGHHQMPDGTIVQVDIDWRWICDLARRPAEVNKTRRAGMGPVSVKVIKP